MPVPILIATTPVKNCQTFGIRFEGIAIQTVPSKLSFPHLPFSSLSNCHIECDIIFVHAASNRHSVVVTANMHQQQAPPITQVRDLHPLTGQLFMLLSHFI